MKFSYKYTFAAFALAACFASPTSAEELAEAQLEDQTVQEAEDTLEDAFSDIQPMVESFLKGTIFDGFDFSQFKNILDETLGDNGDIMEQAKEVVEDLMATESPAEASAEDKESTGTEKSSVDKKAGESQEDQKL